MKTKTMILQNNEGELFFRRDHPDKRTGKQWVRDMNLPWGLQWGMKQREKKKLKNQ